MPLLKTGFTTKQWLRLRQEKDLTTAVLENQILPVSPEHGGCPFVAFRSWVPSDAMSMPDPGVILATGGSKTIDPETLVPDRWGLIMNKHSFLYRDPKNDQVSPPSAPSPGSPSPLLPQQAVLAEGVPAALAVDPQAPLSLSLDPNLETFTDLSTQKNRLGKGKWMAWSYQQHLGLCSKRKI